MKLMTWGSTIQWTSISDKPDEKELKAKVGELAGHIKARFALPNHGDEPEDTDRKRETWVEEPTKDNFDFAMPYVFISYKSEEARLVETVAAYLRTKGVQVWRDAERIKEGEIWPTQIARGLKHATCMLAFWSDKWMGSNNCIAEWCIFSGRVGKDTDPVEKRDCIVLQASELKGELPKDVTRSDWHKEVEKFEVDGANLDSAESKEVLDKLTHRLCTRLYRES
uniref:TIR domain-containing protein n=1 Tax=Palpitomonas bilix TaxID=652834 RepID=A0A7S3DGX8_9EUKA|mmetsp:Transcript_37370/g.96590  ORF Transcript_37370/g.96590 Transcript_37370/m.96590 type:complete len:224 (+) Transcript_37370:90-761(+)